MSKATWAIFCLLCSAGVFADIAHAQRKSPETPPQDAGALQVGDVTAEEEAAMLGHLQQNHQSALEFVVNQFERHDIVLLGEDHQIADNCRFVSSLLEPMYQSGVRTLAWEFTRSRFNDQIAELVTADEFDHELAYQLLRRGPWPTWGYQEYVDILSAAWRLNRRLPPDAPRFRVIALDSEWSQHELWFGKLTRVQSFQKIANREKHMTQVLKTETLDKNEKALVHIGYAHTLTRHGARLGKVLRGEFGARIRQVTLHRSWRRPDGADPLGELLGRLAVKAGNGKPISFDVTTSPLRHLTDSSAGVFRFAARGATLTEVAETYVFLKPLDELVGVTWIPGFIVDENFEHARGIASRMKWISDEPIKTPDELDAVLAKRFRGAPIAGQPKPE